MDKNGSKTKKSDKIEKTKVDESLKKIEDLENKYKRAIADYQNLDKRVSEERKEWVQKSNRELLLRLLPVLDTLVLASKHSKDQGVALSVQQFLDVLKLEGVEKIETIGRNFDPYIMECVDTLEGEADKVLEEFRTGYTLHGQLLRSAQVRVGKKGRDSSPQKAGLE